jgi:hypothetical protein
MKASLRLVFVLASLATPLPLSAQVLDAPTGTYKGTLVHERRLILESADPPRVTSFKQKTKLAGFGYVPEGQTRTFIRLIVPPGAHSDRGLDRQATVDFNPEPPVFEIQDGESALPFLFPTITVDGNTVTVTTSEAVTTPDYRIEDINTLSLKRTKP